MQKFSSFLSAALFGALVMCAVAQPPFSNINTELTCEGCVADGFGQQVIQDQCDNGDFDAFCNAGDCSCPFTIRRAIIMCESDACLDVKTLQTTNVTFTQFFNRSGPYHSLRYDIRAKIFDKENETPGDCDAVLKGETFPNADEESITPDVERAVVKAVKSAIEKAKDGVDRLCDERIRSVTTKALLSALP